MVECKRCFNQFNYSPGPAGNARQLCDDCRKILDKEEAEALREETIIENNKYLVGAPKRKDKFDPLEIMDGNFPKLESDSERFICVMELSKFISRNGFGGKEENIAKFLEQLEKVHIICFLRYLPLTIVETMVKNKIFSKIANMCIDIVLC